MRLVFLGPPGAGKGTQAVNLAERLAVPHISTGDILRRATEHGTPTGLEAKAFMEQGELVPFEIILRMVKDRLQEGDAESGWILDGFPRNLAQAEAFGGLLAGMAVTLDRVVYFAVPDDAVVERLTGRRTCRGCGAPYHVRFSPPKVAETCDRCQGELYQRDDDVETAIRTRLSVYQKETDPLVDHYRAVSGLLLEIDGSESPEKVTIGLSEGLG